jgi:hypothetical protein
MVEEKEEEEDDLPLASSSRDPSGRQRHPKHLQKEDCDAEIVNAKTTALFRATHVV